MAFPPDGGASATGAVPITNPAINANYNIALGDDVIVCDATNGAFTINLPTAASAYSNGYGKRYTLKKVDASANSITIQASGAEIIDGLNTRSLNSQYSVFNIISDGLKWLILSKI